MFKPQPVRKPLQTVLRVPLEIEGIVLATFNASDIAAPRGKLKSMTGVNLPAATNAQTGSAGMKTL